MHFSLWLSNVLFNLYYYTRLHSIASTIATFAGPRIPLPVCLLSPSHNLTRLVDGRELGDLPFLHVLGPNLPLVVVALGAHC